MPGFLAALPYALTGLAAGGGILGGLFGGKKKQSTFEHYDPYEQQRKQLMGLLYQGSQEGVPGLEQYGQDLFQQMVPGIQETYQAKRRLGAGSTPEVLGLGRAAQGVATGIAGQQGANRLNYAQLYARSLGQPTTTVTPAGPSGLENLLNFGAPLVSSYLQGNQTQQLLQALGLGGGGTADDPAGDITDDQIAQFFNTKDSGMNFEDFQRSR